MSHKLVDRGQVTDQVTVSFQSLVIDMAMLSCIPIILLDGWSDRCLLARVAPQMSVDDKGIAILTSDCL